MYRAVHAAGQRRDGDNPGPPYLIFGKGVGGMMSWASVGQNKPTKWMGHIHTADVDAATKAVVADPQGAGRRILWH